MKTILSLLLFCGIALAFRVGYEVKKATAEVVQVQGIYIFTDCKPVREYEYLGTVKRNALFSFKSDQYSSIRDILIQRAKEKYKDFDGMIFTFQDGGTDQADVIRLK